MYEGMAYRTALYSVDKDKDGSVNRTDWRAGQAHKWQKIWLWPAAMAAATALLFLMGFHDRADNQMLESMAEESVLGSGEGPEPQVG